MKALFTMVLCAALAVACDENLAVEYQASGTWILYEQGFSIGSGYNTEAVSPVPAQTLTLNADGSLSTTVNVWQKYKYYLIIDPGDGQRKVLALYEQEPSDPNPDLKTVSVGYNMVADEDGNLKLYFRRCIEGCHLAFRKYSQ